MKIYLISLGCPKNLVDSEQLLAIICQKGFIITDSIDEADLVIINTCAFIKDAVKESLENIKMVVKKNKQLIIWGCLVEREKEKLMRFRNLKGIAGVGNPGQVLKIIEGEDKRPVYYKENCFKISIALHFSELNKMNE
ncbi:MAG: hypothetical protein ACK4UV_06695 [Ignavibacterium sp.]